ncbi:hypothetical protein EII29_09825 [Leptotrichia sp. OH3620_COT-345]|uniref:hypothetical protein n=1 Tax=Leptotrichia sp. OH3620_COT-345 TaxID=2491048 RepID=UPI000F64C90A|nr:hypothetical protein [Leptotrichia sp. OH3620_COT-345]RRD38814.1 hypothetical protein EII29_09825 [Leptotrichia sp. OH3620_COT-345]
MLEKISAASKEVALNEKEFEKINYIPKTILIELCRVSKLTAEEMIKEIQERLIPDCDIFIKIYIGEEKFKNLGKENTRILQELYVAWKLYESTENEKVSEDKRDTLYKLLDQIKGTASDSGSGNLESDNRYGEIRVFKGE